jgi:hypothetical protein
MAYPFQQDKITIYGPKVDGTYVIEFKAAMGETLATSGSVQTSSTAVDWFHQRDAVHGTRGVVLRSASFEHPHDTPRNPSSIF